MSVFNHTVLQWLVQREPQNPARRPKKTNIVRRKIIPLECNSAWSSCLPLGAALTPGPQGAAQRGRPCGLPLGETRPERRGRRFRLATGSLDPRGGYVDVVRAMGPSPARAETRSLWGSGPRG